MCVQATAIKTALLNEGCNAACVANLPNLSKESAARSWLWRWCRRYNIRLRSPNVRYKVSRGKLMVRLKYMWLNTLRVRALAQFALGIQPIIEGIDQKGLHKNEVGSKSAKSMAFAGVDVELKENHAQTRDRFSLMTRVTSAPTADERIPIEILFRSQAQHVKSLTNGRGIFRDISQPEGLNASLQVGPRGSYRLEHVLKYLDTHSKACGKSRRPARPAGSVVLAPRSTDALTCDALYKYHDLMVMMMVVATVMARMGRRRKRGGEDDEEESRRM